MLFFFIHEISYLQQVLSTDFWFKKKVENFYTGEKTAFLINGVDQIE